jgi:hypothetical protein
MGPQRRGVRWLHEMNNDATYGICAPFLYRTRPAATNVDQHAHSYGRHISTLYITTLEEVLTEIEYELEQCFCPTNTYRDGLHVCTLTMGLGTQPGRVPEWPGTQPAGA